MNFRKLFFSISFVFILVVLFSSCETTPVVTSTQLLDTEKAVFQAFLDSNFNDLSKYKTVGNDSTFGFVYWETKTGTGDTTIQAGKAVSYRYTKYYLSTDTLGKLDFEESNLSNSLPKTVIVNDTQTDYVGIFKGLMYMKPYGKAIFLMPSTYTNRNYYSCYYVIEVVFVSK